MLHTAFLVGGGHGDARNDGPGGVKYVALDIATLGLRSRQGGAGQHQNEGRRPSTAAGVE